VYSTATEILSARNLSKKQRGKGEKMNKKMATVLFVMGLLGLMANTLIRQKDLPWCEEQENLKPIVQIGPLKLSGCRLVN
jgi:hypothetical protein